MSYSISTWAQCYKTFYGRDILIFLISQGVCQTRLETFARDKYSSLLRKSVNRGRKKFYNISPWSDPVFTGEAKSMTL